MRRWFAFAVLAFVGCAPRAELPKAESPPPASESPPQPGRVTGRVTWSGPSPHAEPFHALRWLPGSEKPVTLQRANPLLPRITAKGQAIDGAVIFLSAHARLNAQPWRMPPNGAVSLHDERPMFANGSHAGWVPVGQTAQFRSDQALLHSVRGRGADFFTFTLPRPGDSRARNFSQPGIVELSSASGHYWMRGWLFVMEHPYIVSSDAQGNFELTNVPPGTYELNCWLPNWQPARFERDAETTAVLRMHYAEPFWIKQTVVIDGQSPTQVELQLPPTPGR